MFLSMFFHLEAHSLRRVERSFFLLECLFLFPYLSFAPLHSTRLDRSSIVWASYNSIIKNQQPAILFFIGFLLALGFFRLGFVVRPIRKMKMKFMKNHATSSLAIHFTGFRFPLVMRLQASPCLRSHFPQQTTDHQPTHAHKHTHTRIGLYAFPNSSNQ